MAKKTLAQFATETAAAEDEKLTAAASAQEEAPLEIPSATIEHEEKPVVEQAPTEPTEQTIKAAKVEAAPEPEKPFDYQEWARNVPSEARVHLEQAIQNYAQTQANQYVDTKYGKYKDLLAEIESDPKLEKQILQLSNKELRNFLFEYGVEAFESMPKPEGAPTREVQELQRELDTIKQRDENRQRQDEWTNYLRYRDNEFDALRREYPELQDQALAKFVIQLAHERTQIQMARGNNNAVPFREIYLETKRIQGKQPNAPSAPATSGPQAPTDAVEVKNKVLKDLKGKSLSEFMSAGKSYN